MVLRLEYCGYDLNLVQEVVVDIIIVVIIVFYLRYCEQIYWNVEYKSYKYNFGIVCQLLRFGKIVFVLFKFFKYCVKVFYWQN